MSEISNYPNFSYIGNKTIDSELIKQFEQSYSSIIYAYGAQLNNVPQWFAQFQNRNAGKNV
jgi:hypothetical protein